MKQIWILLVLVAALSGCGRGGMIALSEETGATASSSAEAASSAHDAGSDEDITPVPADVFIYICGAVANPGVYRLPAGSRVYAAVEAAGGLLEEADLKNLNQAQLLEDGQQITVYTTEETAAGQTADPPDAGAPSADGSAINLNTADQDALMTLPGVGEARAAAIIAYREQNGAFSAIEDIMQIEGIGEKSFAKLKDLITV